MRATEIARAMVVEYGMSDVIGPLSFGRRSGEPTAARSSSRGRTCPRRCSERSTPRWRALVEEAHDRARTILQARGDALLRLSRLLMAREVMEGEELKAYVEGTREIPPEQEVEALVAERMPTSEPKRETPPPPPPGPLGAREGVTRLRGDRPA